ncbi:peptidase S53 [Mycobacterium sp. CBMA293]|uniref:S53 family peptidase n=2 Tax=Mycolicibacterium TaxID=1866885 RepID=UPI0012DCEF65|nr:MULTISPECIES: S53 family peptidase [unclassified Mycolicibacterium]MUM34141.1 peptidase S53 [Mycolicibacterium sp. CBMA 361]MUL48189.1 peptidase S53 [Mycolicibacterium sp. CBMA 360]MUL57642.1 peptidase S53 [Mycolicibacterium sp. CBMA 335]MUL70682.1 peptidase S53 [Mycolicibacterium sp. CBMA 311]MUL92730.1 peptidase S53 [Mycolicibacterium sp. CBMA 230]
MPPSPRTPSKRWLMALVLVAALVLVFNLPNPSRPIPAPDQPTGAIDGPFAFLLASSTDLGLAHPQRIQLTATLGDQGRPDALINWAGSQRLSVRWRPGDNWAVVEGDPGRMGSAFGVQVHDYRGLRGQEFYAAPQQPQIPTELHGTVTELGRILSYTPHHDSAPPAPLGVAERGLNPSHLLKAYRTDTLAAAGYTGKGTTVVIFAFNGYDQADLDQFAITFGLPKFTPTLVGGKPGNDHGETTMDLEVVHAIAPDAQLVVVNARPTVTGDGAYLKIGQLFEQTDRDYPGAIWSLSIGWGCDKLITAADLAPVRSALAAAEAHGTTAFDASGDLAGLECKGGDDWDSPPGPSDIGLDSVASLPEMTNVGGSTLSTDADGQWLDEQAWFNVPLSQGTGGGVSALFDQPRWQSAAATQVDPKRSAGKRMTPDISAVADPYTGVKIVVDKQVVVGGGTSQAAPIWAGLTAVMNQYLAANGGHAIGALNPELYRIARGAPHPAFRDITLGGNAVDTAGPGYDLVSGLGTPNVENLAADLLLLQKVTP